MSETGFDYDYIFFILLIDMNVDVLLDNKHTYNVVLNLYYTDHDLYYRGTGAED